MRSLFLFLKFCSFPGGERQALPAVSVGKAALLGQVPCFILQECSGHTLSDVVAPSFPMSDPHSLAGGDSLAVLMQNWLFWGVGVGVNAYLGCSSQ